MLIFERKKNKFVRNIASFDSRVRKIGGKMSNRKRFDGNDYFGSKNRILLVPEFSKVVRPNVNFLKQNRIKSKYGEFRIDGSKNRG